MFLHHQLSVRDLSTQANMLTSGQRRYSRGNISGRRLRAVGGVVGAAGLRQTTFLQGRWRSAQTLHALVQSSLNDENNTGGGHAPLCGVFQGVRAPVRIRPKLITDHFTALSWFKVDLSQAAAGCERLWSGSDSDASCVEHLHLSAGFGGVIQAEFILI